MSRSKIRHVRRGKKQKAPIYKEEGRRFVTRTVTCPLAPSRGPIFPSPALRTASMSAAIALPLPDHLYPELPPVRAGTYVVSR